MLTNFSGPKLLIAAVAIWGISILIFDLDHDSIEAGGTRPVAAITATAPATSQSKSVSLTETIPDPKPADMNSVVSAPARLDSKQLSAAPEIVDAGSKAVIAALKAATAALEMAAATLKLAADRNADLATVIEHEPLKQTKSPPTPATNQATTVIADGDRIDYDRQSQPIAPQPLPSNAQRYLVQGRQAAWQGYYQEASAHFRMAVSLAPKNSAIHGELGNLLYTIGNWPEAVEQFIIAFDLHLVAGEHQRAAELLPILQQLAPARAAKFKLRLIRSQRAQG